MNDYQNPIDEYGPRWPQQVAGILTGIALISFVLSCGGLFTLMAWTVQPTLRIGMMMGILCVAIGIPFVMLLALNRQWRLCWFVGLFAGLLGCAGLLYLLAAILVGTPFIDAL